MIRHSPALCSTRCLWFGTKGSVPPVCEKKAYSGPADPWSRKSGRNSILLIRLIRLCVVYYRFTRFSATNGAQIGPKFFDVWNADHYVLYGSPVMPRRNSEMNVQMQPEVGPRHGETIRHSAPPKLRSRLGCSYS